MDADGRVGVRVGTYKDWWSVLGRVGKRRGEEGKGGGREDVKMIGWN